MGKRSCKGKAKTGKPCKAAPLKGSDRCMAHSDAKVRESAGFVADNGKAGRPRLPSPTEVAKKLIEENVAVILRPHFRVLGHDVVIDQERGELALVAVDGGGAKLYGESREGIINESGFEDLGAQMAAADKLMDRIYGRPKQATEISGPGGGPIEADLVGVPTERQFQEGVAKILAEAGAAGDGGR